MNKKKQREINSLKKELEQAHLKTAQQHTEILSLTGNLKENQLKVQSLTSELAQANAEIKTYGTNNLSLTADVEELELEINSLTKELLAMTKKSEQQEQELKVKERQDTCSLPKSSAIHLGPNGLNAGMGNYHTLFSVRPCSLLQNQGENEKNMNNL